jgi:hypothetical protein
MPKLLDEVCAMFGEDVLLDLVWCMLSDWALKDPASKLSA